MNEISLVIRNAKIVDGTGRPSYLGDVGISGDRITAIGRVEADGVTVLDAKGHVLSPGFIEIHTHYDPHLCWDRLATPALEHGFTTIITGNCSLGMAPIRNKAEGNRISRLFAKIEDLDEKFFEAAVPYSWESFSEYLDYIRPELGINVGALVPHTPLRHYVMGDDANQRAATDEEIAAMCKILAEAIQAGALGISFTYADSDENNVPVASCLSDLKEKIALARTVTANNRRFVQAIRDFSDSEKQMAQLDELAEISLASGALCAVLTVIDSPTIPGMWKRDLEKLESLQQRGARVLGQSTPRSFDINFTLSKMFMGLFPLSKWMDVMALPVSGRIEKFRDLTLRAELIDEAKRQDALFQGTWVVHAASDVNRPYEERKLADIAAEQGKGIIDTLLDLALAEDLETEFAVRETINGDVNNVSEILNHPLIQIGGSDSGAHVTQFSGAGDSCFLIEHFVRKHGKMTLGRAIQRMTSDAALDTGILDRGTIEIGRFADLVIFDPDTIARGAEEMVHDIPGGGGRYVRRPSGIDHVIVNGEVVVSGGAYTGVRSGRIV
jgi:N-acyl-D-amino-acid deacylase